MPLITKPSKIASRYNGSVKIEFFEGKHAYSLITEKGKEKLISVTGVTSILDKSRPLMFWQERITREYLVGNIANLVDSKDSDIILTIIENAVSQHRVIKEEAANKGKQVHEWCENYIKKVEQPFPEDEQVLNGVTAFLRWIKEYKVKFLESEKLVYSKKYKFVGIMDLKAKVNGKLACVDFKTSSGVYNEMRYQVAGYMGADSEETGDKYDERWIIKFGKDTGDFEAYKLDDFKKDYAVFLALLVARKREQELVGDKLIPVNL